MPRHGNTRESKTRHYKAMKSSAKGKGHDSKRRLRKRNAAAKGDSTAV